MTNVRQQPQRLISELAAKEITKKQKQLLGVLMTEPALKYLPGPNSTTPLKEGDDPATHPGAVQQWFVDVRLDAGGMLLRDAIVPNQARALIGQRGSPVTVWKDISTGAWQVLGRADRRTDVQSVVSYTTVELGVGYVRGYVEDGAEIKSPFWAYTQDPRAVVNAARDGHNEAGLNRGVRGFDSAGNPIDNFQLGVEIAPVPFLELEWLVDNWMINYETTHNPDGSSTQVKIQ